MNESHPIAKNIAENTEGNLNTEESLIIQWFTQHHWTIRRTANQEMPDKEPIDKEPIDKEPINKEPVSKEPVDKEATSKTFAQKTWQFKNYHEINAFLPQMAEIIRDSNHHPDLMFKAAEKTLTVSLTTHCAGNTLSQRDLDFAKQLEAL